MKKFRCEVYTNVGMLVFKTNWCEKAHNKIVAFYLCHRFNEFEIKVKQKKYKKNGTLLDNTN